MKTGPRHFLDGHVGLLQLLFPFHFQRSSQTQHLQNIMVQSASLLSTLLIGACCVPAASFTPGSSLQHARLDRLLEVVSSDAPAVRVITSTSVDNDEEESFSVKPQNDDSEVDAPENQLMDLPPVLQQITDERRNFQMNLGKAMDTLRKDMPYILKRTPGKSVCEMSSAALLFESRISLFAYLCSSLFRL